MLADIDELEKDIDIVDLLESPVEEPAAWLHYLNVRIRDDASVYVYIPSLTLQDLDGRHASLEAAVPCLDRRA